MIWTAGPVAIRSSAARVPSVDPSLTTMISREAGNWIVSSLSTTAVTLAASLKTGTMIDTRGSEGATTPINAARRRAALLSHDQTGERRKEVSSLSLRSSGRFVSLGDRGLQHRQCGIDDDHNYEPADCINRQRGDDIGGQQHAV